MESIELAKGHTLAKAAVLFLLRSSWAKCQKIASCAEASVPSFQVSSGPRDSGAPILPSPSVP